MGVLAEVFLLVLILSIFILFWNYYSRNTFLVGLLAVRDSEAKHTCAALLFPLVSNEYIKSVDSADLEPINYFTKSFLNMSELVTYPTPDYLLEKIRRYYKGSGIRVDIKVFNGTAWLELQPSQQDQFISLLLGSEIPSGACSIPLFSLIPDYSGRVNMSVRI